MLVTVNGRVAVHSGEALRWKLLLRQLLLGPSTYSGSGWGSRQGSGACGWELGGLVPRTATAEVWVRSSIMAPTH